MFHEYSDTATVWIVPSRQQIGDNRHYRNRSGPEPITYDKEMLRQRSELRVGVLSLSHKLRKSVHELLLQNRPLIDRSVLGFLG
jgi:hypothetical protein